MALMGAPPIATKAATDAERCEYVAAGVRCPNRRVWVIRHFATVVHVCSPCSLAVLAEERFARQAAAS